MKRLGAAAIIALLLSFLYYFNTLYVLEYNLTDRLTKETREVDRRIKVLAIDDESLKQVGQWPWPRDVLAGLEEKLVAGGAKAVWTDVLYTEKSQNPKEDEAWTQLLSKYQNVFLPAYFNFKQRRSSNGERVVENVNWPVYPIGFNQVGHINRIEDSDGVIRQVLLGVKDQTGRMVPAIGVRLANLLLPQDRQITWDEKLGWTSGAGKLPADRAHQLLFSYASSPSFSKFETIPIWQVIDGKVDPSYFKDSVVLIGIYTEGLQDSFLTPVSRTMQMYGVDVHANIVQSLLDGGVYRETPKSAGVLIIFALALIALGLYAWARARWAKFVVLGLLVLYTLAVIVLFKTNQLLLPFIYPFLALIGVYLSEIVTQYLKERRERNRVTGIFGRYVSKGVVKEILSSKEEIKLGGVRKDVSLMFIDIRGFTPLSEKMEPEDVINILNEYLDLCTKGIFSQEGTLDKFIGDGVMAIFGAPVEQPDHAERAVRAALQIRSQSGVLSQRLIEKYGKSVGFGIGINTGPAVIGNIGSQERLDYTAIGDTVNLAARLESNAKASQILVSKGTYLRVADKFNMTALDPIKVKGKELPVEVFQVDGFAEIKQVAESLP